MIIDFGTDSTDKKRPFVGPGSFYVALTRVKNGNKVYLKSFDKSYIVVDPKIKEKVSSFIKFNSYQPKKVYLDEMIFEKNDQELKMGYLNCRGILDGGHGEYINFDRNLLGIDLLVLAETMLTSSISNEDIQTVLTRWKILKRLDATDGKHMGLLLLVPREKVELWEPHIESFMHFSRKLYF